MGAMVFGDPLRERLQLNLDTFWSGGPYDPANPEALEHLAEVRRLIWDGRNAEAQALANRHMMGRPRNLQAYQPLADLRLRFAEAAGEPVSDYSRGLDLERGLAFVRYVRGGVRHERTVFASAPDQAVVVHLACGRPGGLSLDVSLDSVHPASLRALSGDLLGLSGHWEGAPPGPGSLRLRPGPFRRPPPRVLRVRRQRPPARKPILWWRSTPPTEATTQEPV
jgi:alpha-L-fucosidase 2